MTRILLRSIAVAAIAGGQILLASGVVAQDLQPVPAISDAAEYEADQTPSLAEEDSEVIDGTTYPYYAPHYGVDAMQPRPPILFQQYYAQPGYPAGMYPAPIPTPPIVGHVYYTNEAMMPHEFLYSHSRVYYNNYGNYHSYGAAQGYPSYNKTRVVWNRGTIVPFSYSMFHPPRVPPMPGSGGTSGAYGVRGGGHGNCAHCR